jgi:hypothetical protein
VQSAQTHRVNSDLHASAVYAAQHRNGVAELADESLNLLQQLGAIAQANDQHVRTAQCQRELTKGANSFQADAGGI